jgi:hypothetical protein
MASVEDEQTITVA